MQNNIKRIWNTITTVLVALAALLAILLWGVRLIGLEPLVVRSGSMEPAYPVGALIYIKETAPEQLGEGDVITFHLTADVLATHRIVDVQEVNGVYSFQTKGDANEYADGYIPASKVEGKVVFSLPQMGYLVTYVQQPPGSYAVFSVAALLLLMMILPDILFGDKNDKQKTAK